MLPAAWLDQREEGEGGFEDDRFAPIRASPWPDRKVDFDAVAIISALSLAGNVRVLLALRV